VAICGRLYLFHYYARRSRTQAAAVPQTPFFASEGIALPPHLTSIPIFPESDEACMSQMIVRRPFHILELSDQDRLQPAALLHFVSSETLSPSSASGLGEVCEWALGDARGTADTVGPSTTA
jgi:hypothetical protein